MANSLDELYKQYKLDTVSVFSEDSGFAPLMAQIEGGKNNYNLFSRRLEKTIDLRWVDKLEECIIPLDTIIRNPRRFIVQEEEIVPIEKAKKITAESVRHLAQHTNMINSVKKGVVTPNRILNVFREESFDIYENRFIYTLLLNLRNFIQKRYDAIFKLAGDENVNVINVDGTFRAGKDEVTYSLKMNAKKTASMFDTEDDSNDVFLRIERIRKIVDEFASSSFANEMSDCVLVRPPITRTNVIQKEPNFVKCLDLWIFIESYNEVGYEITVDEKNEPLSEDYINDLNQLMAVNYMLLKNNSKDDFELSTLKKRRKIKPRFIKNFIEELVNDYDISDDEIKRIFVDQIQKVTSKRRAQEGKIEEAIQRCLDTENKRKADIIAKIKAEEERKAEIERKRIERERIRKEKQEALEKARKEREIARAKAKKEREERLERERKEKERLRKQAERERIAKEKAAQLEKERLAKQKAKEKAAKEKAAQLKKERLAKERAKAKEKAAKEKAIAIEKERLAKEKAKAKEKAEKEKTAALEKERIAKEKAKAREKAAKEKAAQLEKERLAKERAKAKEKAAKEKAIALEKERIAKEKAKAKAKAEKEKASLLEKERIAKEKAKAKERAAKEKAKILEKERIAKAKAKAKAKAEKDKLKNKQ